MSDDTDEFLDVVGTHANNALERIKRLDRLRESKVEITMNAVRREYRSAFHDLNPDWSDAMLELAVAGQMYQVWGHL